MTWRRAEGREGKQDGKEGKLVSHKSNNSKKDNNDNDNTFRGFHQLLFEPPMLLISHSRQVEAFNSSVPLNNCFHGNPLGLDFSVVILS